MRKEAQEYRAQLLAEIKGGAASQASTSATASSSVTSSQQAIKRKLVNAVSVMQEGLVEREAEVRGRSLNGGGSRGHSRGAMSDRHPPLPPLSPLLPLQVRLLLLAAMSGEHILLIGPPGTAKSEVGRRLNKLISGTYFERLLTRFSVPEVGSQGWGEMGRFSVLEVGARCQGWGGGGADRGTEWAESVLRPL